MFHLCKIDELVGQKKAAFSHQFDQNLTIWPPPSLGAFSKLAAAKIETKKGGKFAKQ